jgi:predicted amidohydrolase
LGISDSASPPLNVAALQVTPRAWDKEGNFAKLERFARQASADGAQLVVTPEGFLEGYLWQDDDPQDFTREQYLEVGETIDGDFVGRTASLSGELGIYLGLGFAERQGSLVYNSMAVFGPNGELVSRHFKCHTADDEPYNAKGTKLEVFETPFGPWGVLICMDRQPPESMRVLALKGAQLVIVPAWGMCGEMNDVMMRTRAYENGVYVLFVHPRRCLVIDPGGKIVAEGRGETDTVVHAEIALADFSQMSPIQYRRPELYGEISRKP